MFQLQPLSQRDPRWANTLIGTDPSLTIGKYGCLLADLVMVVNGFGQNETPDSLNAKMKAIERGYQGPNVVPVHVPEALPGILFVD